MTKELLRLYHPLAGYILIVRKNENDGTINLVEETVEENGKIRRLWNNPKIITISGTDAEYLEQLIEQIKVSAKIFISDKFGKYNEVDWDRFQFGFYINSEDLWGEPKCWVDLNEKIGIRFDPCPEPKCIPPFTPYECTIEGISARLVEYRKKGNPNETTAFGWTVRFDVWAIKRCIMGFIDHLKWYYNELKKLEEGPEEEFDEEEELEEE